MARARTGDLGVTIRSLQLDAQTTLERIAGAPTDSLSLAQLPRLIDGLVDAANYLCQRVSRRPRQDDDHAADILCDIPTE
jgi:hypothetical protein